MERPALHDLGSNKMNSVTIKSEVDSSKYIEQVVRNSGSSFYWAMRNLPKNKRLAMFAIYAFCREVDDLADEVGKKEEKLYGLRQWRDEIEQMFCGRPRIAICQALMGPVKEFNLKKDDFYAVIDGMEMDALDSIRILDMDELILYCDRVACAVGRLSVKVFGLDDKVGTDLAFEQGLALQLTNILRDLDEDARSDRLYIPRELLESSGITGDDLSAILNHTKFEKVCENISNIAEKHFYRADKLVAGCDKKLIRPAIMMLEVYRSILQKLKRRGWKDLSSPVGLSRFQKLFIAFRYGFF